jgi:ATP-dependent Lon protease
MVFTRNQKRGFEKDENYSNVQMKRTRKKDDNNGANNNNNNQDNSEKNENEDVEMDDISTITSDEEYIQETTDDESSSKYSDITEVTEESESDSQFEDVKNNLAEVLLKKILNKRKPKNDESYESKNVYNSFFRLIDSIYDGSFFERIPQEEKKKFIKENYSEEQMKKIVDELESIKKLYKDNAPSVIDILKMNITNTQKQKLLEKMHHLCNTELLSNDYNSNLKYILTNVANNESNAELMELEEQIIKHGNSSGAFDSYKRKILTSKMTFENKVVAYKKLEIMETYEESDTSEYAKYKNWMDTLLSVPFGEYIDPGVNLNSNKEEIGSYIKQIKTTLNSRLSFLEKPKDQIINIVTQSIRNPNAGINAIGLWGSKGLGKTSIVKSISEALNRPYRSISLGGESDSSVLTGHGFTYVGSNPGRIIEILRETKCMNPIILVDELDKVSQTYQGKEIIGTLIHLTDMTTNSKYTYDRYFSGIEFDLSKVLFIFTYNDPEKVDKILADRLFKIKVENYNLKEKLEITKEHIIKNVLQEFNFTENDISFTDDCINYIVNSSNNDEGMRDIKRKIEIITSRINTLLLTSKDDEVINLKYKTLYDYYCHLPITVQKEHVDTFLEESISSSSTSNPPPFGMYI